MKSAVIAAVVILAAGATGYWALTPTPDPNAALIAACEEELQDRLRAPSTYERLEEPYVTVEQVEPEDAAHKIPPDADDDWRALHDREIALYSAHGVWRHRVILRYEAKNAMGVPLADHAICDAYSVSTKPPEGPRALIRAGLRLNDGVNQPF